METFVEAKPLIHNSGYHNQRQLALSRLRLETIDPPILDIIKSLVKLPYCFSLQSCFGHFLYADQTDLQNLEPLPRLEEDTSITYRIAYLALCVDNSDLGRQLLKQLNELPSIHPGYIQYGCAQWFWERQINSYVVQVEPERHQLKDQCILGYQEALIVEKVRYDFFNALRKIFVSRLQQTSR